MIKEYKSRTFDEDILAVDSHSGKWSAECLEQGTQLDADITHNFGVLSCRRRKHQ